MKISIIFLVLCSFVLIAAVPIERDGYKLTTKLNYVTDKNEMATQSTIIISKENKTWTMLTNTNKGVLLLGKMVTSGKQTIHMEYIISDTTKSPQDIVPTASIIARFDNPSKITLSGKNKDKVEVELMAQVTKYTENK